MLRPMKSEDLPAPPPAREAQSLEDAVRTAVAALPPAAAEALRRHPDQLHELLRLLGTLFDRREADVETVTPVVGPEPGPGETDRGIAKRTVPYEPAEEVLSSGEAAARIGLRSRQAVHDRLRKGAIVGWKAAKRGHVFPARQFDEQGRVIPGVCEIVEMLGDAYGAWAWLTAPDAACGGEEPLALLARGQRERVLDSARSYQQGDFS